MTDGQITLLILVVLIIYEATRWIPVRTLVFQPSGERWNVSTLLKTLRSRGCGISLLNPIPPNQPHLNATPFPFAPHDIGLAVWNDETGLLSHIGWDQFHPKADSTKLHLTPRLQIRFLNAAHAKLWEKRLLQWQSLSHDQRCADYAKISAAAFDLDAIRSHADKLKQTTRPLRRMSNVIFFWTLLVIPLTYWMLGDHLYSYLSLGILLGLTITQAVLLWRTIKRHHPELKKELFPHLLGTAFYPPTAIRISDWICLAAAPEFHPLGVMRALPLADPDIFSKQTSLTWRMTLWPVSTSSTALPSNGPEVKVLKDFLIKNDISIETLESPPTHLQSGESYCPRCHSTYQGYRQVPTCHDCRGVPLLANPEF